MNSVVRQVTKRLGMRLVMGTAIAGLLLGSFGTGGSLASYERKAVAAEQSSSGAFLGRPPTSMASVAEATALDRAITTAQRAIGQPGTPVNEPSPLTQPI